MVELQLGLQVQGGGRSVPRVPRLRLPPLEFRGSMQWLAHQSKGSQFLHFLKKMEELQADLFEISKNFNFKWN